MKLNIISKKSVVCTVEISPEASVNDLRSMISENIGVDIRLIKVLTPKRRIAIVTESLANQNIRNDGNIEVIIDQTADISRIIDSKQQLFNKFISSIDEEQNVMSAVYLNLENPEYQELIESLSENPIQFTKYIMNNSKLSQNIQFESEVLLALADLGLIPESPTGFPSISNVLGLLGYEHREQDDSIFQDTSVQVGLFQMQRAIDQIGGMERLEEQLSNCDIIMRKKYQVQIEYLNSMGFFDDETNLRILNMNHGDLDATIEWIINNNSEMAV